MANHVILKCLKVYQLPNGELDTRQRHKEGAREPLSEEWWGDVLHDRRLRIPTTMSISKDSLYANYRLDRQLAEIWVTCRCGRSKVLNRDQLIEQVGGEMNVIWLAREAINCKQRSKVENHCMAVVVK
jgi:hypothetical protein